MTKKKELKLLTVNACCPISGITNKHLPVIFGCSGVFVGIAAIVAADLAIVRASDLSPPALHFAWIFIALFPLGVALGAAVAGPFARIFAAVFRLFFRVFCGRDVLNEYKLQRLRELAALVKRNEYDIVCMQEMFGGYVSWPDYPAYMANLLRSECGLAHQARPGVPDFPSLCMNSGLLIASRYPISSTTR